MPQAGIHVGRPAIDGGIARYARAFDLLEVIGEAGRHPRRPGLLEWRRLVPERFVFSVVVPSPVANFEQRPDRAELMSHARMVADALAADWWLIRTPPSVTPSARAQRDIEALVKELRDERRIAWEPRGLWSEEDAQRVADQLGIYLVKDLARQERSDTHPVVYTRLRALGEGARIGAAAAERVAERVAGATDCYVVVEGSGAGRMRQVLREMAGVGSDAADTEEDAEASSDDEDDEGGAPSGEEADGAFDDEDGEEAEDEDEDDEDGGDPEDDE